MTDPDPKTKKSRKAKKKKNGAPLSQSGRLDSPGSLSSADNASLASADQDSTEPGFRQVHSRRSSRSSTPSGFAPMIDGPSKTDEEDACSIKTVAESKALLNKWTGQVVANGGCQDGVNGGFSEAFLRSRALDLFVERYVTFGDLDSIKGPLTALLGVLVPDGKLEVALDLAYALLRMARRFGVFPTPEDADNRREAVVGNGVALLKSYIAEKKRSAAKARAQLEERRGQVIWLEVAMDKSPTPRELQQFSARLVDEVQSRLALESSPVGVLEDIHSLEDLLEKGIEDSRKSTPARREELQQENSELTNFILQKQTEKEELELKLSEVMAELDQSQARQRAVEALLSGNTPAPRIPTDQLKKQLAAVQELKKAAESALPKDEDAVDFTIQNRAENAPGPEGLSPADFLKHCLCVHNRNGQQVLQKGQEMARKVRERQQDVILLENVVAKEEVLKPARDALAALEEQMKELQEKARVLLSGGDAAIALARAQRSLLAPAGALAALEQVHADLSAACKEVICGPKGNAMPPVEAARENKAKSKQRKPRALESNGSAEAAVAEAAPPPAAAARADAPQGKSGNAFEANKPRPAQRRGPGNAPAKTEMSEAERMRAARDKAKEELGINKGQRGAPSRAQTAAPRPVANGAAQYKPAASLPPTKNPWNKKVSAPNTTDQPSNGHAEAAATKAVAPSSEGAAVLVNGHAEAGPATAANCAPHENGAALVENGSTAAAE